MEVRLRKKSGEVMICSLSAEPICIDGVDCILCVTIDITERKAIEQKLRQLAHYDVLTSLANRAFFLEQMRHALALATRG